MAAMSDTADWPKLHETLLEFGLTIKPHGNGLVIRDLEEKHSIKASDFDRAFSKAKLEKRLGAFQPLNQTARPEVTPKSTYEASPLQKDPDRDGLYQLFQESMSQRRAELEAAKEQEKRLYNILQQQWDAKYKEIAKLPMLRQHRQRLMDDFKAKKRKEIEALRHSSKQKMNVIRKRFPYNTWNQFLREEAARGQETALAILRSKTTKVLPERPTTLKQNRTPLAAVTRMENICQKAGLPKLKYKIDGKGTIIFSLPDGGTIRDNGKEIHFSQQDINAKSLAEKLPQSRWGQTTILKDGLLRSRNELGYLPIQPQPAKGL